MEEYRKYKSLSDLSGSVLGMADIRRKYGGYTVDILRTCGGHTAVYGGWSADLRRTFPGQTANTKRTIGEHTANMRQKWLRTYGNDLKL